MTLCEENCKLIDYDYLTERAKCSCDIKITIPLIEEIRFNKEELYKSITDINNLMNVDVMKCYKQVFNKKDIINNYGFYFMIIIIFLFFICLIIFISKSFDKLKYEIKSIIFALKNELDIKPVKKTIKKIKLKKKKKRKKKIKNKNKEININNEIKINFNNSLKKNNGNQNIDLNDIDISNKKIIIDFKDINLSQQKILEYKDFELNSFEYEDALKTDKRTYFQYYFSLLKINHLIIFSFCPYKDYNSRIIKMFLFFSFSKCI